MQDNREPRYALFNLFENVEAKRRGNEPSVGVACALFGLELVSSVRSAYGDSQRIHASLAYEVFDFFGAGVRMCLVGNFVFDAGENSEFAFNGDIVLMRIFNNFFRQRNIVLVLMRRTVDHHGREAVLHAGFAELKSVAVVEVQNNRNIVAEFLCVFASALRHVAKESLIGVFAGSAGNLQNDGRFLLDASLYNRLHLLHIIEVKRRDCVFAGDGFFEKLSRIDQTEFFIGYHNIVFVKMKLPFISRS